jgi:hypothetical protein
MDKICKHKKKGGLGIKDIRKMNLSLLCKWWWKSDNEEGLWQDITKFKYLKDGSICDPHKKQYDQKTIVVQLATSVIEMNLSLIFFSSIAKAIWAIVARCIGGDNVPRSLE